MTTFQQEKTERNRGHIFFLSLNIVKFKSLNLHNTILYLQISESIKNNNVLRYDKLLK